jgi:WD40 repeat protein
MLLLSSLLQFNGSTLALAQPFEDLSEPSRRTDRFGDPLPERALARMGNAPFFHGNQVSALAYSPDGKYLASSSGVSIPTVPLNCIRLWDAKRGGQLRQFRGHFKTDSLSFTPHSNYLVSKGSDRAGAGEVCIWEIRSGSEHCRLSASCCAVSPNGESLALAKPEGTGASVISIRQLDTCRLLKEFRVEKNIVSLLFSADGESLIAGEGEGSISA